MGWVIVFLIVAGAFAFEPARRYLRDRKESGNTPTPESGKPVVLAGAPFPCVIEGTIEASPMVDRVIALAKEAATKGILITGDYQKDVAAQGGEMTLVGYSFKFVFDANGQIDKPSSHANLFGANYPVEGGMNPDGSLGMDIVVDTARVQVQGKVVNGVLTNGKVVKTWLFTQGDPPHIYGVLNGTWRKV